MIFRPHFLIRRTSAGALGLALVSSGVFTGCAHGPRELFTSVFRPGAAEEQLAEADNESSQESAKKSYFAKLDKGKEGDDDARVTANRLADDGPESRRRPAPRGTREAKDKESSGTLLAGFMKRSDVNGDREVTDPFLEDVEHADYNENDSVQKPQTSRIEQISRNDDPLFDRSAKRTPKPEDFQRLSRMGTDASAPSRSAANPFADGFESELDRLRAEVSQDPANDPAGSSEESASKHPFSKLAADGQAARESEREHLLRARESELRQREIELAARERELKALAAQEQQRNVHTAQLGFDKPAELTAEPASSLRELRDREDSFAALESNLQPLPPSANLKEVPADYSERQHSLRQHPVEPDARSAFESMAERDQSVRNAVGEMRTADGIQPGLHSNAAERSPVRQTSATVSPLKSSAEDALRFGRAESSMIVDASSIPHRLSSEPFTLTPSRVGEDVSGGADGNLRATAQPQSNPDTATPPHTATAHPRTVANHPTDVWQNAALPNQAPAAPAPPTTSSPATPKSHRDLLETPPQSKAVAPAPPAVESVEAAKPAKATRALGDLQWGEEPQAAASRRVQDYWGTLALLAGSAAAAVVGYCLRHKLPLIRRRQA